MHLLLYPVTLTLDRSSLGSLMQGVMKQGGIGERGSPNFRCKHDCPRMLLCFISNSWIRTRYARLFLVPTLPAQSLVISPEFQHILRILNTNIDGRRKVQSVGMMAEFRVPCTVRPWKVPLDCICVH